MDHPWPPGNREVQCVWQALGLEGQIQSLQNFLRIVCEFVLYAGFSKFARQTGTQRFIREQAIEGRSLDEPEVAIIAVVAAKAHKTDTTAQGHR
jgi:hypothetical protein